MLRSLDLLDTPPEAAFDDLTTLCARFLGAPVALLSLVDEAGDRQFFKSQYGLPEPVAIERQTPLSRSFCKLVTRTGTRLRVVDARIDPRVADNPVIHELGVIAYLGLPVTAPGGTIIGSLCAIDSKPRDWSQEDEDTVLRLSHMASAQIALRRSNTELREERAYFKEMLDTLPVGVTHVDAQGKVIFLNKAADKILAFPEREGPNRNFDDTRWKITTPSGAPFPTEDLPVARILAGEERVHDVVHAIEHPDGTRRVLSINAAPTQRTVDGTAVVCAINDVTDRLTADAELREREALFATLTDLTPFGIAITDHETAQTLQVNQSLLDQNGYTREEFLALDYAQIAAPESHGAELIVAAELRQTGHYAPVEQVFLRKDGTRYPVRCRGQCIPSTTGRNLVCHFIEDISAEKAQMEELARLGDVAQYTKNIVIIADCDGLITWANPAFVKKTGWPLSEVKGRKPGHFLHSPRTDQKTVARIGAALRAVEPVQVEILNQTRDGEEYWLSLDIQPRFDSQQKHIGFIAVEVDITDYRRQQDILRAVATFSQNLLTTDDLRAQRDQMLAEIGAAAGVHRAFAFRLDNPIRIGDPMAEITVSLVSEWCAPGIAEHLGAASLQALDLRTEGLGDWVDSLSQGQPILLSCPENMTAAARTLLQRFDVTALAAHPVIVDGACVGVIGFAICDTEKGAQSATWSPQIIDAFVTAANSYAAALERDAGQTRLMQAVNALNDGFSYFDADERLVLSNKRYVDLHPGLEDIIIPGASFSEILQASVACGKYAVSADRADAWIAERLRDFRDARHSVSHLTDGRVLQEITQATADGGRVKLTVDVTELYGAREQARAAEDLARRAQQQLVDAVEALEDGFLLLDAENRIVLANNRYKDMYPRTAEAVIPGARFEDVLHHAVAVGEMIGKGDHTPEAWINDILNRVDKNTNSTIETLPDGRIVRLRDTRTREGGRVGLRVDITDITRARDAAEAASRAKTEFLTNMSHEIRTPLNSVLGMTDLLADTPLQVEQRDLLEIIRNAGWSLLSLLNDILDLARIEAGRLLIDKQPFVPRTLAEQLGSLHGTNARAKGLEFALQCEDGLDLYRIGDEARIRQILHNLLGNAVKFTERGSVTLCLRRCETEKVLFRVSDTGIGMTEEQVARIFTAFEQADAGTTRRFGGTGLGMTIVRRLVDLMEGDISIESSVGQGTSIDVVLRLPINASDGDPQGDYVVCQTEAGSPDSYLRGLRVLAADDNAANRKLLSLMMEKLGVTCLLAKDGAEALEMWRAHEFDIILLDISMPVMDGLEALQTMLDEASAVDAKLPPVLAATANVMPDQIESYLAAGFSGVLPKPFRRDDLVGTLVHAMGS